MPSELTVLSAIFYKKVEQKPGHQPVFSGRYKELLFTDYPTTQTITLAMEFRGVGNIDGYWFIRVRHNNQVIHETSLSNLHAQDRGTGGNFGFISNIQGIAFPEPGIYTFDIIFDNQNIFSTLLTLIKPKDNRKRHFAQN